MSICTMKQLKKGAYNEYKSRSHGIDAAFSLLQGVMELETALKQGDKLLKEATESIARVIHLTREYGHSKRGSKFLQELFFL
ncbi:glycerate kinase [Halalkalibacterium ligniniphilum]|uniref:glycerate kinase n=1 Tax=Halalkalibacterium ligniniphilum TaxID=1134413 RepID=UPI000364260C|nr:glycerate kinase [Halalkalibacterium ligniniphilum]